MVKKKVIFLIIIIGTSSFFNFSFSQTQSTNLSMRKEIERIELLDIKERVIRIEEGQKALNQRIDDLDKKLSKRIDDLANLIYGVLAGMFALVGFVIWDRRSALAPAIRKTKDIEERQDRVERAIKELALKYPEIKEILKTLALL